MTLLTRSGRFFTPIISINDQGQASSQGRLHASRPEVDCDDVDIRKSESELRGAGHELIEGGDHVLPTDEAPSSVVGGRE